jgi:sensor histidine kinase YesM
LIFLLSIFFCDSTFAQQNFTSLPYKYRDGLPSDYILSIQKKDGFLYFGSQRGLSLFDGYRFINHKILKDQVRSLFVKNNTLYLSNNNLGIAKVDNFSARYEVLAKVNFSDSDTNNDHYDNLFIDNQNRIWCSDQNNLKFFSQIENKHWKIDDAGNLSEKSVQFFQVRNDLWVATTKGVFIWNEKLKTLQKHSNPILANNEFSSGYSFSENEIFLTNFSGQLFRFEPQSGKRLLLKSIQNLPIFIVDSFSTDQHNLLIYNKNGIYKYDIKLNKSEQIFSSKSEINTVFYDKETKLIWAGTNSGLQKIVSNEERIQNINFPRKDNQKITTIAEDQNHNLWMCNNTSEIFCLKADKTIKVFHPTSPKTVFTNIFIDKEIWFSATDGVYKFDNHQFKKVISLPYPVKKMIKDNKNQLWILSSKNGIKVFDATTFQEKKNAILNTKNYWKTNTCNDIVLGVDGEIWLASWMPQNFGISFFEDSQKVFKEVSENTNFNNRSKFVTDYYNRIAFTKNNNILFSGFGGWNLVAKNGNIIHSFFTSKYKVANDHIEGIAEDSHGNIWFGCAEGLYQYNPKTDKAIRISQIDGLESNDITFGFYKLNDDRLAIASDSGIQILNLKEIVKTQLINHLKLTSVQKDNVEVPISSPKFIFDYNFTELDFNFSALSFSDNEKIIYRYRFSDEKKWNYLGTTPKLALIKLPAGDYEIIVEAGDNLGNWQKKQLKINLKINPPFYFTFWFIGIVFLLFVFIAYLIVRFLLNQEKEKSKLKQTIIDVEMKTLRSQMNPHFLFNSLNSINSFIVQQKSKEASTYLTTFSKLMRNILENSRQETISLEKELETLKMYLQLETARLDHGFDYQISINKDIDAEFVQIPPLIIQPFVENAIWHGLVNKKGHGFLKIEISKLQSMLHIKISDNGIGREASAMLKKEQVKHKSYGIKITRQRIEMLNPKNELKISDLDDEMGNKGTLVELKIMGYD